jgi:hypothetical protein
VSRDAPEAIFCSDWAAAYGTPYLEAPASSVDVDVARIVEDDGVFRAHDGLAAPDLTVVFVDGVRRMEAHLTAETAGTVVRGVSGAHGVGSVVCAPGQGPRFERCASRRYLVWEGGKDVHLPRHPSGFAWEVDSIAPGAETTAEARLQDLMRDAERTLAEELSREDRLIVLDGPLNRVRTQGRRVMGYVKTHHRIPLDAAGRAVVATLVAGQRTSLFLPRDDVYSAYVRMPSTRRTGVWGATVRLEIPTQVGLRAAADLADLAAALLPRYAGVGHIDPRAPQNLQPVAALERYLRHGLGDVALAVRATRESVAALARRDAVAEATSRGLAGVVLGRASQPAGGTDGATLAPATPKEVGP